MTSGPGSASGISGPGRVVALPPGLAELVLQPVRGANAFEATVESLSSAIRLGVFLEGERLPPERELAERLGVSRATLREAIAALREAGFVSTTRGRGGGTVVSYEPVVVAWHEPTDDETRNGTPDGDGEPAGLGADGSAGRASRREDLLDCLAHRRVVEGGAAWIAAGRDHPVVERVLLQGRLAEVEEAVDAARHRQADSRLHLAIASLTGSRRLVAAVTEARSCIHDLLDGIPVLPANIEHSNTQHRQIVSAILSGHQDRARHVMEQHCDDTAALLRGLLP